MAPPNLSSQNSEKFQQIRRFLRDKEVEDGVMAASIKKDGDYLEISYDKDALFECANPEHAHSYATVNEKLDYAKHGQALNATMNYALSGQVSQNPNIEVVVRPQNKVLPLPIINIPIPFTERAANRVRPHTKDKEDDSKGLQAVRVTLRVPLKSINSSTDMSNLWVGLNKTAMVHTSNKTGAIIHEELAGRASQNPLRKLGHWLSDVVPSFVSRILPNWLVNFGRVKQYGSAYATQVTDQPVINSAYLAQTANVATVLSVGAVVAGICYVLGDKALSGGADSRLGFATSTMGGNVGLMMAVANPHSIDAGQFCQGYLLGAAFNLSLNTGMAIASVAVEQSISASSPSPFYNGSYKTMLAASHEGSAPFASKGRINNQKPEKTLGPLQGHSPVAASAPEAGPGEEEQPHSKPRF